MQTYYADPSDLTTIYITCQLFAAEAILAQGVVATDGLFIFDAGCTETQVELIVPPSLFPNSPFPQQCNPTLHESRSATENVLYLYVASAEVPTSDLCLNKCNEFDACNSYSFMVEGYGTRDVFALCTLFTTNAALNEGAVATVFNERSGYFFDKSCTKAQVELVIPPSTLLPPPSPQCNPTLHDSPTTISGSHFGYITTGNIGASENPSTDYCSNKTIDTCKSYSFMILYTAFDDPTSIQVYCVFYTTRAALNEGAVATVFGDHGGYFFDTSCTKAQIELLISPTLFDYVYVPPE